MTQEFQENTVAIILNEMFNDSKKLKTQMQFDALTEAYAERIVKLFFIPDVSNSETWLCMGAGKNKERCKNQCVFCSDF